MLAIAKIVLYAWVPFVLMVFAVMKPRRAVIFAYIGGWLFLPMLSIKLNGIPDLTKFTASSFGVLLGAMIFDTRTLLSFRPKWFDIPMFVWCFCPYVTSEMQDLGWYDGASNVLAQMAVWGIPYFIGRCYFKELEAYRELGIAIVMGALIYMPFTWLEMKISPLLHKKIYGFFQHSFEQTKRWGSFRPMVFMQSGLALAMYMTVATVTGVWMWLSGSVKKLWGLPMGPLMFILFATAILCKTMAAIAFLFAALGALIWIRTLRSTHWALTAVPIIALVLVPPTYMILRGMEIVDRDHILHVFSKFTSEERLRSLEVRLIAEDKVTDKALTPTDMGNGTTEMGNGKTHDPWWGWGKWDPDNPKETPWRIYIHWDKLSPDGIPYIVTKDDAPTDGLWIITLGQYGKVGVIALTITILLPVLILWRRVPLRYWHHSLVAPAAAMSLLLCTHMIDNLLNGMVNPLFMIALGGLSAIGPAIRPIHRRFGPLAAQAMLDQLGAGNAGSGRGFPNQPMGYPQMPQPGFRPIPAGMQYPQQPAMPAMPGFPAISGLQAGSMPLGAGSPRRRR
jgi:hypothetical protein